MCGRFALKANENEIISHFHLKQGFFMRARYNLAPTQTILIISKWGTTVEFSRWGFIPFWAKSEENQLPSGHINARLESVSEKPTFKAAFKNQRCLIPASGYFEWRTIAGKKQPYYVYLKQIPLIAFAGIWSSWRSAQGEMINTCAIMTTSATPALQKLHERMPVIVAKEHYRVWLEGSSDETLEKWFIYPTAEMVGVHAVSQRMSNPRFEGVECIQSL